MISGDEAWERTQTGKNTIGYSEIKSDEMNIHRIKIYNR